MDEIDMIRNVLSDDTYQDWSFRRLMINDVRVHFGLERLEISFTAYAKYKKTLREYIRSIQTEEDKE